MVYRNTRGDGDYYVYLELKLEEELKKLNEKKFGTLTEEPLVEEPIEEDSISVEEEVVPSNLLQEGLPNIPAKSPESNKKKSPAILPNADKKNSLKKNAKPKR